MAEDLKPENVLLDSRGPAAASICQHLLLRTAAIAQTVRALKLTDMGLAKLVIGKTYTTRLGTLGLRLPGSHSRAEVRHVAG